MPLPLLYCSWNSTFYDSAPHWRSFNLIADHYYSPLLLLLLLLLLWEKLLLMKGLQLTFYIVILNTFFLFFLFIFFIFSFFVIHSLRVDFTMSRWLLIIIIRIIFPRWMRYNNCTAQIASTFIRLWIFMTMLETIRVTTRGFTK